MQVASVCPQCGESYLVAPQQLGRTVRCQHCGRTFVLVPPQRPNPQQPGGQWQAPGGLAPRQASLSPGGPPQPPAARAEFDPYHQWLGIAPEEQPPHHYRLLGLKLFENSPAVIENAADRQMAHLRTFQSGKQAGLSQRLLNEVAAAKLCLLKAEKKAPYDEQLRRTLAPAGPPAPPLPPGLPQPPGLPPDPRALRQLGQYMARQQPADVAGVSGPFAAGADAEAVSDYGGQMPPEILGSPDDGTQPGLESSAAQDYGWMKEGPAQPAPKRRRHGASRGASRRRRSCGASPAWRQPCSRRRPRSSGPRKRRRRQAAQRLGGENDRALQRGILATGQGQRRRERAVSPTSPASRRPAPGDPAGRRTSGGKTGNRRRGPRDSTGRRTDQAVFAPGHALAANCAAGVPGVHLERQD